MRDDVQLLFLFEHFAQLAFKTYINQILSDS